MAETNCRVLFVGTNIFWPDPQYVTIVRTAQRSVPSPVWDAGGAKGVRRHSGSRPEKLPAIRGRNPRNGGRSKGAVSQGESVFFFVFCFRFLFEGGGTIKLQIYVNIGAPHVEAHFFGLLLQQQNRKIFGGEMKSTLTANPLKNLTLENNTGHIKKKHRTVPVLSRYERSKHKERTATSCQTSLKNTRQRPTSAFWAGFDP